MTKLVSILNKKMSKFRTENFGLNIQKFWLKFQISASKIRAFLTLNWIFEAEIGHFEPKLNVSKEKLGILRWKRSFQAKI